MIQTTFSDIRDKLYLLMYLTEDTDTKERVSGVSKNIYMDALPTTMPAEIKDCVMLDFNSAINDLNAYGYGTIRVWLLSPDSNMGETLAKMEEFFNETVLLYSKSADARYIELRHRFTYAHHDANRKLRGYIKELRVKIKK